MKVKVEYITKVEKEIEVPDKWVEWAENDWNDDSVYHEIEEFWNSIKKNEPSQRCFEPIGMYYGDNYKYYIVEY